ncbi:MAG: hypothetical protein ABJH05_08625 [Fulvivirga sp.]
MILRFIKFGWAVSLVAGLGALLYVYASIPEHVVYSLSDKYFGKGAVTREVFFYSSLGFMAFINFLLYALSKNLKYQDESINELIKKWQLSLAVLINIFAIVIMNFVFLVNSGETFNFDNIGYLIYVSFGFIVLWIIALPILLVRAFKRSKQK